MTGRRAGLAALAAGVVAAGGCSGRPAGTPPASRPRLHHVHLRVPDPAAEMDALARAHGCEKQILPGLGVGVRCGDAWVLFERDTDPPAPDAIAAEVAVTGSGDAAEVSVAIESPEGDAARAWLEATYGIKTPGVFPAPLAERRRGSLLHLAIALPHDPDERLVTGPGGLVVEQLRDAGTGPDAFWCPMHLDVRSPAPGTCPLCGMALVAIPETTRRRHVLDVDYQPLRRHGGRLRLAVRDAETGDRVTSFLTTHERLLHLFVISRQLDVFEHVHPSLQPDGRFVIDLDLPRDDAYMLVADVHPSGGLPEMLQALWVSPGYRGNPFPGDGAPRVDVAPKVSGSVRVSMADGTFTAGQEQAVTFTVTDARSGAPVRDLEPYLGAPGHLVIVSDDLGDVVHSHPADGAARGPSVGFDATFPRPGAYKMWVQVQREGVVHTAAFVVDVR